MIEKEKIKLAEKCLMDNGIEANEVETVLQAIGYILIDEELYPEGDKVPDMKIWKVPVCWQACGHYFVRAKSFEDAAKYIEKAKDIPLPADADFIDSTFKVDYEGKGIHNNEDYGTVDPIDTTTIYTATSGL